MDTPREEPTQIVPLQQRPLQGPSHPTETPEDATTVVLIGNLIRMVQRQTSLIEEQNRRLMDLEQARPTVQARLSLSPIRNRRGENPSRSRSRSPRHSVSIRSPSYTRRSTRRSPPWSPPRRSPIRRSLPRRSPPRRASSRRSPPRRILPGDLHPGSTGVRGRLLVQGTLTIPEQTATITVRSHGVSGKLPYLAD
jgi:hypothetical protein